MQQPLTSFQQPVMVQQQSGRSCTKPLFACVLGPLLLLGCLIGTACACVFVIAQGNPDPLYDDYEPDQALANNYEDSVSEAVNNAVQGGGQLTVEIRDDEFSSWLNLEGEEFLDNVELTDNNINRNARPTEFQVRFDNQEVQLYLVFELPIFDLASLITAEVSTPTDLGSESIIDVNLTGFKFGSIDVLTAVEGDFETNLGDLFVDRVRDELEVRTGTRDISVTSVNVDDGVMQINGTIGQ